MVADLAGQRDVPPAVRRAVMHHARSVNIALQALIRLFRPTRAQFAALLAEAKRLKGLAETRTGPAPVGSTTEPTPHTHHSSPPVPSFPFPNAERH